MQGGAVQPWDAGINEKDADVLVNVHQIQGVGHDLDLRPFLEQVQGGSEVFAAVQDADQWFVRGGLRGLETLLFAVLAE